jgi:putative PIG3 family NAD(P)H quinone oxidoreductase
MNVADLPQSMTVIEISTPGGPEVLKPVTRPMPAVGSGDVLIRVEAAGVNRPDLMQRLGKYPPPPGAPDVPGMEVAGVVAAVGSAVDRWRTGDRVMALVAGGGYAEYCAAPALQCLPIPRGLSVEEAAGMPETYFTVWTNVFERARLQRGESILIHGGASGIGTTAIQMSRAFGARVFATAGSPDKCAACERLGAERAIDYRRQDFVEVVKELTGARGVDVILDMVGAGSTLRPRTVEQKGAIARALEEHVWPLVDRGELRPVIHATFPLRDAALAHAALEAGGHVGKIILTVDRPS